MSVSSIRNTKAPPMPGKKPVEKGRAGVPDVDVACRAGGKPNSDLRHISSRLLTIAHLRRLRHYAFIVGGDLFNLAKACSSASAHFQVRATMRNRRLVSGAKFLAGKAVASPGDSLEARRCNLLVAPFTGAVSAAGTTTKRIVDFP